MSSFKNIAAKIAFASVFSLCVFGQATAADGSLNGYSADTTSLHKNVTGTTEGSNNALNASTDVTTRGANAVSNTQEAPLSSTIKGYKVNPATGKLELMDIPVNTGGNR